MSVSVQIPPRHVGRSMPINKQGDDNTREAIDLTREQLDIWEHATLLYHSFDWQASGEIFLFLSRTVGRSLESTLCLLNAAMVFARCGEYPIASQILDEAEPDRQTLALTMFLLGHVEFEMGNFEKAEDSLKVALHSLGGPSQSFASLGLDYVLRASHIKQSLRVFEEKNELVGMLSSLGALPADGVFEAPLKHCHAVAPDSAVSTTSRDSFDSSSPPSLTEISTPSTPTSPVDSVESLRQDPHIMEPEDLSNAFNSLLKTIPLDRPPTFVEPNTKQPIFGSLSKAFPPPRNARRLSLEPRQARVQGDSVGGLANFIRTLPSQNKSLQAKDAQVKADSTTKLADFLRSSGPEEGDVEERPVVHRKESNASASSIYSDEAESVSSTHLRNLVDDAEYSVKYRATPPPGSRHPYRSGLGAMLSRDSVAYGVGNADLETTMTSDALHDMFCDDESVSMDWPLTEVASRSLRDSYSSSAAAPSRSATTRAVVPKPLKPKGVRAAGPTVPARDSSLRRGRATDTASTVSSSRFFSHVAKLR